MTRSGTLALLGALVCFSIFFANVALGAAGVGEFMSDLTAMLTLFVAAILFVIGILQREAASPTAQANAEESVQSGM